MFSKKNRLKKKEFEKTFKKGAFLKKSFFNVYTFKNTEDKKKISFVVPKKIEKKAAKRNKNKRQILAFLKLNQKFIKNKDYIFILNKKIKSKEDLIFLKDSILNFLKN